MFSFGIYFVEGYEDPIEKIPLKNRVSQVGNGPLPLARRDLLYYVKTCFSCRFIFAL